jgi:hypothetical protein
VPKKGTDDKRAAARNLRIVILTFELPATAGQDATIQTSIELGEVSRCRGESDGMCFGLLINLTSPRPAFGRGGPPGPPAMTRQEPRSRFRPVLKADEKGRQASWSMLLMESRAHARPAASM